jgi:hypothetical protein
MYCIYCGTKIEDSYNVCPNCGALLKNANGVDITNNSFVNNMNNQNMIKVEKNSNWRDTLGMVCGCFGLFFAITIFFTYEEIILENTEEFLESPGVYVVAIVLWQILFATIALCSSVKARKSNPNNTNKAAFIMSFVIYAMALVQIILVLNYQI